MKTPGCLIAISAILIVVFAAVALFSGNNDTAVVCFGGECFHVETAASPQERRQGLMGREMPASGMLFIFPSPGAYSFWMKNTFIPLDILWLGSNGTVLHTQKNARPCTQEPCKTFGPPAGTEALYVLEVNAGFCSSHGISEGAELQIRRAV
jgi:hypothetical protein